MKHATHISQACVVVLITLWPELQAEEQELSSDKLTPYKSNLEYLDDNFLVGMSWSLKPHPFPLLVEGVGERLRRSGPAVWWA